MPVKRLIRNVIASVVEKYGYAVVPTDKLGTLPQANYLKRLFAEFGVTGVIDVGANEGQYHDFIRTDVGFRGPMVSVEPIPTLAASLRERQRSDSTWRVEQLALGAEAGSAEFTVMASSQFSSFLEPIASTQGRFRGATAPSEKVQVTVDTLDALIARHRDRLGDRIYLKLDTQGFDLEALKGLREHVGAVVALQSESSVRAIYKGMPSYHETIRFVEGMGYTVSEFFPNNEGHFPVLFEFDCHFVRVDPEKLIV
jgi:FkbM family methyltransferase